MSDLEKLKGNIASLMLATSNMFRIYKIFAYKK